jgi:hypothetical protein
MNEKKCRKSGKFGKKGWSTDVVRMRIGKNGPGFCWGFRVD